MKVEEIVDDDGWDSSLMYVTLTENEIAKCDAVREKFTNVWDTLIKDELWIRAGEDGSFVFNGYGDGLKLFSTVVRFLNEDT